MIMKKHVFIFTLMLAMIVTRPKAQTIDDARKDILHEKFQSGLSVLKSILQKDNTNADAWYLITNTYLRNGGLGIIRDSLSFVPATIKSSPVILCAMGAVNLYASKSDSASYYFNQALAQTKQKDPEILYLISTAYIDAPNGNANYAIELLNKAIKKDKRNAKYYIALGNAYRALQNGAEAYKSYNAAISNNENCAEAYYSLGKIFLSQKNPEMYLKYFYKAVSADSAYAPAWYALYYHYYFKDPGQAMNCLAHFINNSDPDPKNAYLMTDLLYLTKKYNAAITSATGLLNANSNADARLYKLIAYSYYELNDTSNAFNYMHKYFGKANDPSFILKDYETMGELYAAGKGNADSAAYYFDKAITMENDSVKKLGYYKKLSYLYKKEKDYAKEAKWLRLYYNQNPQATNLDLFNWGLANYMAGNYKSADSVFERYTVKYPEQTFGFYWRARSCAAIDTTMELGLAVPYYTQLIELASKDTTDKLNRKHLIESYGYIAAYLANVKKEYAEAISYFEKLLALDPGNADAEKYISILKKNINAKDLTKGSK